MASMLLLDEAMHKNGVKVGVYTPNLCTTQGFSGDMGTKKTAVNIKTFEN
jgi:hypothetical protein